SPFACERLAAASTPSAPCRRTTKLSSRLTRELRQSLGNRQSRGRSAAAPGYSSWPSWDGRKPVPRVNGIAGLARSLPWDFQEGRTFQPRCGLGSTHPKESMRRFYNQPHRFYAGVDLHARAMYVCVLDEKGAVLFHHDLDARPDAFLTAVAPFRDGLVVGCECLFAWYWLADLCAEHAIPFVLGHALYLKAIHGGKNKN